MRDPNRIPEILSLLQEFWEKYPDLRLGQVVFNLTPINKDPFYTEDDVVLATLKDYLGYK